MGSLREWGVGNVFNYISFCKKFIMNIMFFKYTPFKVSHQFFQLKFADKMIFPLETLVGVGAKHLFL